MKRPSVCRLELLALLLLLASALVPATAAEVIDPFVGEYVGRTIDGAGPDMEARDASVVISKVEDGFVVMWTTVIHRAGRTATRKSYSIPFRATKRQGIFASAMKRNKFGSAVPLDPLQGDPYVWAKIVGDTLTVYAMLITDEGGYEMQIYERTLTETGMELRFSRVRDGETQKTIRASLARANN